MTMMMMIGWRKKMMMMRVNLQVCKPTTEWEVSASYLKRLKLMSLKRCKDANDDNGDKYFADDDESHFQHLPLQCCISKSGLGPDSPPENGISGILKQIYIWI